MSLISAGSISLDSTCKGLSEEEGRAKFAENLSASHLIKIYQMRQLLAWIISLVITFK